MKVLKQNKIDPLQNKAEGVKNFKIIHEPKRIEGAYLESTGTQWIDSEFIPNSTSIKIEIDCKFNTKNQTEYFICGVVNDGVGGLRHYIGYNGVQWYFGLGNAYLENRVGTSDTNRHILISDSKNKKATVDGTVFNLTGNYTKISKSYILFGYRTINSITTTKNSAVVYSFKLYDDDILVRDMYPVIYNGIACMYCSITKKYYYNQGTGEFLTNYSIVSEKNIQYFYKGVDNKLYHEVTNGFYTSQDIDTLYLMRKFNYSLTEEEIKKLWNGGRVNDFSLHKGKINILPYGCTECEYLESTGTQWIDTKYKANENTKVELKFECKQINRIFFGYYNTPSSGERLTVRLASTGALSVHFGKHQGYTSVDDSNKILEGVVDKNKIVFKNIKTDETIINSMDVNSEFINNPGNLYLFGYNNNGVISQITNCVIFYLKIYDNDILVRDMRPILDSQGRPCMYDLVNKEFYYNQGTGEFKYKLKETKCISEYLPQSIRKDIWYDTSGLSNHLISQNELEITYEKPYQETICGSGTPSIIPDFISQTYINESNGNMYISKGVSSINDWILITT